MTRESWNNSAWWSELCKWIKHQQILGERVRMLCDSSTEGGLVEENYASGCWRSGIYWFSSIGTGCIEEKRLFALISGRFAGFSSTQTPLVEEKSAIVLWKACFHHFSSIQHTAIEEFSSKDDVVMKIPPAGTPANYIDGYMILQVGHFPLWFSGTLS